MDAPAHRKLTLATKTLAFRKSGDSRLTFGMLTSAVHTRAGAREMAGNAKGATREKTAS